jgi:hypothetical protein
VHPYGDGETNPSRNRSLQTITARLWPRKLSSDPPRLPRLALPALVATPLRSPSQPDRCPTTRSPRPPVPLSSGSQRLFRRSRLKVILGTVLPALAHGVRTPNGEPARSCKLLATTVFAAAAWPATIVHRQRLARPRTELVPRAGHVALACRPRRRSLARTKYRLFPGRALAARPRGG